MAFWKPHANPVSWWSCRYWLLWINTAGPCGECRRCWKQWELCSLLPESWEQSTCERMIFTLRPSTAGNAQMRWFSIFLLVILFLLITCGLKFSVYASWTDSCVSHALSCVRTQFSGIFRFLGCVTLLSYLCKIFCSSTEKILSLMRSS